MLMLIVSAKGQTFFEIDTYTTGVGGSGSGYLGANAFTFSVLNGGRIGANTSSNNSSGAYLDQNNSALIDQAFANIDIPTSVWGNGRADTLMVGAFAGNQVTFNFATPQENLMMLLSYFDGNWEIDAPFTISTDFNTLAINGSGDLYSTIYDGSIPSFNLGRGVILFDSPVSSFTMTKIDGPADDFYIGLATPAPVPEPSGAIFVMLAGVTALYRRRR